MKDKAYFNIRLVVSLFLAAIHGFAPYAVAQGPDVIVADIQSISRWGKVGNITAYSIGTHSCNIGTERVSCISSNNQHPVTAQNMYRLKDGRFEQIGQSWLVHWFYVVNQSLCSPCYDPTNGTELGIGCSDPMSAYLNAVQVNMSMRSDVNPYTGYFPYPWTAPAPEPTIGKRIQVADDDLDPDLNPEALYFVEGHYIAADDVAAGNGDNNASWRRVIVSEPTTGVYDAVVTDLTQRGQSAIEAWQSYDPEVSIQSVDIPDDGRFWMGTKVTYMGNETWRYEYAIQNLNVNRAAGSFMVPVCSDVNITDVGFHDIDYHSGEPYDNTDWTIFRDENGVSWSSPQTYAQDANTNALRWGTLYNFWIEAKMGPSLNEVVLELFVPGTPSTVFVSTTVPGAYLVGDFDYNCDVDFGDFAILGLAWLSSPGDGNWNQDCDIHETAGPVIDMLDLAVFVGNWLTIAE